MDICEIVGETREHGLLCLRLKRIEDLPIVAHRQVGEAIVDSPPLVGGVAVDVVF